MLYYIFESLICGHMTSLKASTRFSITRFLVQIYSEKPLPLRLFVCSLTWFDASLFSWSQMMLIKIFASRLCVLSAYILFMPNFLRYLEAICILTFPGRLKTNCLSLIAFYTAVWMYFSMTAGRKCRIL